MCGKQSLCMAKMVKKIEYLFDILKNILNKVKNILYMAAGPFDGSWSLSLAAGPIFLQLASFGGS